jgi:hypothetical protein
MVWNKKTWTAAIMAASLGIIALATIWPAAGEPYPPADEAGQAAASDSSLQGQIAKLLRNDRGDLDGLELEDGKQIRFPPHVGIAVEKCVKVGDSVTAQGREETRPRGEKVFEAAQIESQGTTLVIERPRPPRGPRPGGRPEPPMSAKGKIRSVATNPHGDVDGLMLEDGTEVKFPPHQGRELSRLVSKGDEVNVEGRRHETPHGDVHLHADRITNVATGKSVERDEPHGRRPPPPHGPRNEASADYAPQLDEILHEVRELRRLIESQKRD